MSKQESNSEKSTEKILEYDLYVKMPLEDTHLLGYISEADDHIMNIRHAENEEHLVKIIVPADLLDTAMEMLELLKTEINLEVVKYGPNPGHP